MRILFPDMDGAFDLDVQQGGLARLPDAVQLTLEGTIKLPFVDHLPFHKFIVLDLLLKTVKSDEIIIYAILLVGPWAAGGCGNGKSELVWKFCEQIAGDGCLPGTGWSRDDND